MMLYAVSVFLTPSPPNITPRDTNPAQSSVARSDTLSLATVENSGAVHFWRSRFLVSASAQVVSL